MIVYVATKAEIVHGNVCGDVGRDSALYDKDMFQRKER